jgi:hypothetical protein
MYNENVDILLEKYLNEIEICKSYSSTSFYIMQKFLGMYPIFNGETREEEIRYSYLT